MTESIKDDMREHQHEWCKNPIDDKYYYAFVLGYDLLQDKFMKYHGEDEGGSGYNDGEYSAGVVNSASGYLYAKYFM